MYNDYLPRTFNGCTAGLEDAETVVFGAPFDGTASFRPGSRFAPQVMRIEHIGVELYSPYQDKELTEFRVHDAGDLNLPFGGVEKALEMVYDTAKGFLDSGKKMLMIGGEHLVTLPAFTAALEKYPDLCLIHFDAHTDLREEFFEQKMSHATVIRKIWDKVGDGRIFQFGIRSGAREEFYWAAEGHTALTKHNFDGLDKAVEAIGDRPVYFTLDVDVLDPSVMPGTGTTEGGGVTFMELLNAILTIKKLNIVSSDIVELAPHYDQSGVSTAIACKLLREILIAMGK